MPPGSELPPERGSLEEARVQGLALSVLKWLWKRVSQIRQSNRCFRISHICQGTIHEQRDFLQSCGFRCHGLTSFYFLSACRFMPPTSASNAKGLCCKNTGTGISGGTATTTATFSRTDGSPFAFSFQIYHSSPKKEDSASRPAGGVSL